MSTAEAATSPLFHTVRIADTNTPIPGATGNFTKFAVPSSTSFAASGTGLSGVYQFRSQFGLPVANPTLSRLADTNTLIPGGIGAFTGFDTPSYDFYFHATGAGGQEGIYRGSLGSSPSRYVDTNTPIPGGTGTFTTFHPHTSFGVFYGEGTGGQKGIYRASSVVVNASTQVPESGFFTSFGSVASNENATIFFQAGTQATDAVYLYQFDAIRLRADSTYHIDADFVGPTLGQIYALGTGHFTSAFAVLAEPDRGVYHINPFNHSARTVATASQIRPDSPRPFGNITDVVSGEGSIESGPTVAFRTLDGAQSEIYFSAVGSGYGFRPTVLPVIGTGDILDGRQVASVALGDDGLYRYTVTFRADFTDGSSGIYPSFALEPEPSALLPATVILLTLRRTRRIRTS